MGKGVFFGSEFWCKYSFPTQFVVPGTEGDRARLPVD